MKTLTCSDAGFECETVIRGESDEEILNQAAEHARAAHNVEVTPEIADQIKTLIRDE